ncbi:MAG: hypothetical protein ACLPXT_00405 [Terracidiphilus sp.]
MQKVSAAAKKRMIANVERIASAAIRNQKDDRFPASRAAAKAGEALAYKMQLPGLGSVSEIKENIEAVAQGIAMGFFTGREGSQLLYAAQVALSVHARERTAKVQK